MSLGCSSFNIQFKRSFRKARRKQRSHIGEKSLACPCRSTAMLRAISNPREEGFWCPFRVSGDIRGLLLLRFRAPHPPEGRPYIRRRLWCCSHVTGGAMPIVTTFVHARSLPSSRAKLKISGCSVPGYLTSLSVVSRGRSSTRVSSSRKSSDDPPQYGHVRGESRAPAKQVVDRHVRQASATVGVHDHTINLTARS